MPIPTVITDLSATAASNYPAGSDAPSALDDVQRAQGGFIRNLLDATQSQAYTAFTTGGTTTAYTLTPSPALTALAAGQRFAVKFNAANTSTTPTLAISGLTAKSLKVYGPDGVKQSPAVGAFAINLLSDVVYDGTDYVVLNPPATKIQLGTAVATTSGTSIDFTGIPSWVKRITVMLSGVSTSGTSDAMIRLGTASGVEATGYATATWTSNTNNTNFTTGFFLKTARGASDTSSGHFVFTLVGSDTWVGSGTIARTDAADMSITGGSKTLAGTLDRLRLTTAGGTDTFDAGSVNILYEG